MTEITDDLGSIGCANLADDWLTDDLESGDVEAFRDAIQQCLRRAAKDAAAVEAGQPAIDLDQGIERVATLVRRLDRLVAHEVALTDQYADDLDD